ncbi:MAG: hypothetical protein WBX15_05410 [Thermoanaerobaculia bacterium]
MALSSTPRVSSSSRKLLRIASCVLVLSLSGIARSASGQCTPPQPTSPADGASVSGTIQLEWSPAPGAIDHYDIYLGDASLSSCGSIQPVATVPGTQTTFNPDPNAIRAGHTYIWRVVSASSFTGFCSSLCSRFTVQTTSNCPSDGPSLASPATGSTVDPDVTFSWRAVSGASKYVVMFSVDAGLPQKAGETTETSLTATIPVGNIVWWVDAVFPDCPSTRSTLGHFTTEAPNCDHAAATLLAPADGTSDVQPPVTFQWSAVPDAIGYRVWASVNGNAPALLGKTSGETTLSSPVPSGTIAWWVEAVFRSCPAVVSAHASFTVTESASCNGNSAPDLVAPAAGATGLSSPVTLSWNAAPGAFAYKLWVSIDGRPFEDIRTTSATAVEVPLDARTIGWFVQAFFNGCPPITTAKRGFTLAAVDHCDNASPLPISPAAGSTVHSPATFTWSAVNRAVAYRLWIVYTNGVPRVAGQTPDTSLSVLVEPGKLTWFVQALFRDCPATHSQPVAVTVAESSDCANPAPELTSPPDGWTSSDPTMSFAWNPVSGAVAYELMAQRGDGVWTPIGITTQTAADRRLPPGSYRWRTFALFPGCKPVTSDSRTCTVTIDPACIRPQPMQVSPPDGAETGPVADFLWTPVDGASAYNVYASVNGALPALLGTTTDPQLVTEVPPGRIFWAVEAMIDGCASVITPVSQFTALPTAPCDTPSQPRARSMGHVLSGDGYPVQWTPLPGSTTYEIQESSDEAFSDPSSRTVSGLQTSYQHDATSPTSWYYRVRAIADCSGERGAFSAAVRVVVAPPPDATSKDQKFIALFGEQEKITQKIFLPGSGSSGKNADSATFTATSDDPWLSISPSSGTIPPEGATLTISMDPRRLDPGANTSTVNITTASAKSGAISAMDGGTTTIPISLSLVTPATPSGKTAPTAESIIIPAVAHADGVSSKWVSDVRVSNLSTDTMHYQLYFTPSGQDGTTSGYSATLDIAPGQTGALDDVLANWFGKGSAGESSTGVLEVRPVSASSGGTASVSSSLGFTTLASSRTYNDTSAGTFGQFIPGVRFTDMVSKGTTISLQQIAQSSAYRTNLGLVEGAGEPATVLVKVFDPSGTTLTEFTEDLQPGEQRQLDQVLATKGISLDDGRIEVSVLSDTGKVTAYASTIDMKTGDPILIAPAIPGAIHETKYVVPGVADLKNGIANWQTDMRIFNGGASGVTADMTLYPTGGGAPVSKEVILDAGKEKALNNVVQSLFESPGAGGAVQITTAEPSSLVVTARTYNQTSNGTYGQFIPAVMPDDAIAAGDRPLQILQVEQSDRFRTNLGITEVTGNPVTVEISATVPGALTTAKMTVDLPANGFTQLGQVLKSMGMTTAYNARISVRVVSGSGKITAYGSVIDMQTQDPTYVPAQ